MNPELRLTKEEEEEEVEEEETEDLLPATSSAMNR